MCVDESILLTYSNENRLKFQRYAEFFRLIGVYVCENLTKANLDIERMDFSKAYNLDNEDLASELSEAFADFLVQEGLVREEPLARKLIDIFNKQNLLQASVTLQYFCINTPIMHETGELFESAAEELQSFYDEFAGTLKSDYQLRYAKLYCKQKANLACYLEKSYLRYSIKELLEEAFLLQVDFSEYSNVWMLIGLICEISKEHKMQAIEAFKVASNAVKDKPYASSILYRLGKNCEETEELVRLMNDSYELAHRVMPKYRNAYKVARQYMKMDEWDLAIAYFQECIDKITIRAEYVDPLEQEYYFKVNSHLSYIYLKKRDYVNTIKYAEAALDLRDKVYHDMWNPKGYSQMYYDIYNAMSENDRIRLENWSAEKFIRLELDRMSVNNIYLYLATAYQELGMDEMAEECWYMAKIKSYAN